MEQEQSKGQHTYTENCVISALTVVLIIILIMAVYHLIQFIVETGDEKLLKASKTLTRAKIRQTKVDQKIKEIEIIQEKANNAKLIAETSADRDTHNKAKKILIKSVNTIRKLMKDVRKAEHSVVKEAKKASKQYKEAIIKISKEKDKFILYGGAGTGALYSRKWSKYYLDHTQDDTFATGRSLKSNDVIQLKNVATGKLCGDDLGGILCDKNEEDEDSRNSKTTSFRVIKSNTLPKYVYDFVGIQQDASQKSNVIMAGDWIYLVGGRNKRKCYTYGPSQKVSCNKLSRSNAASAYSHERKFKIYLADSPFVTGVPIKNGDKIGIEVLKSSGTLTYGLSTMGGGIVQQNSCNGNNTQFKQMTCDRQYAMGESTHFIISIK